MLNQNPQNKASAARTVHPGEFLGSGIQPKPSELVGNLASGLELSELSYRMRQEVGLTPQVPADSTIFEDSGLQRCSPALLTTPSPASGPLLAQAQF